MRKDPYWQESVCHRYRLTRTGSNSYMLWYSADRSWGVGRGEIIEVSNDREFIEGVADGHAHNRVRLEKRR